MFVTRMKPLLVNLLRQQYFQQTLETLNSKETSGSDTDLAYSKLMSLLYVALAKEVSSIFASSSTGGNPISFASTGQTTSAPSASVTSPIVAARRELVRKYDLTQICRN
jgi:hypothetical protein